MSFWQRVLILLVAVVVISFVLNVLWHNLFGFALPSYASGIVGGISAVPIWDLLKRVKPREKQNP